ncbi:ParB family protein [Yersinia enterocolitica]|uniref:ATP/GTP binding protein n=1 Tax=Yersinia enterocolitica serotype O:8 / biotype 1B (strain NCTC 13174 / 8081) TaxID=393305 RepID=A1JQ56_YERE8|nr:ParB family protein [Yersinia enterocolitica]AJJ24047.1 parB-like nuclease domain protein [Yersinia enterocolitica]CAL13536.1 putative ATP/GTP binding protein [Yersinia enterocolitica subsp. enterocolitica 8081]
MNKANKLDLSDAMLQRGKSPVQPYSSANLTVLPVSEMAMVLTLDQLRPNPDNPRTTRNRKFEDIKASIRTRGLDSIPKVTRVPDGEDVYIFSDGGNTRYQVLCELWQETGDERFYRIHTIFKPWPGRLQCVIGHLTEDEIRGELTYIEKSFGIHKARTIWEDELGRVVTLRELSQLLNQQGYPIHSSTISRMEDTLKHLYPVLPALLDSGLPRIQVLPLLTLRSTAEKTWKIFSSEVVPKKDFCDVFSDTCCIFNHPDTYSLEMFRDELIGKLLKALPHPSLNYDRWLIELDPKEQQRREIYGNPTAPPPITVPIPESDSTKATEIAVTHIPSQRNEAPPLTGLRSGTLTGPLSKLEPGSDKDADTPLSPQLSAVGELIEDGKATVSSIAFAATGLEPVKDIWYIPALQDDIEHLQDMAYRLAFELSEAMGCADNIVEYKQRDSAGYSTPADNTNRFVTFLLGLTGHSGQEGISMSIFCQTFLGSADQSHSPILDDIHLVKVMRLMRVLHRLRQLQRETGVGNSGGLL